MPLARGRFEEALRIGLEVDDAWVYLNARAGLHGIIDMRSEADLDRLRAVTQEMLGETRRVGNAWAENRALVSLATVALRQGDESVAQAALEEGISVARHAGDSWSLAMTLVPLADLERSTGHHARARPRGRRRRQPSHGSVDRDRTQQVNPNIAGIARRHSPPD